MRTDLAGISLKNPLIAASGTFGFGQEFGEYFDPGILGAIATKGLTLEPRMGNRGRRIHETPAGMMNSIGLQNPSVAVFIAEELPRMRSYGTEIIANVGGAGIEDYEEAIELLEATDISIIELNISCPNVKEGGMAFGIRCSSARRIVRAIRRCCTKKLMVKLSPNAENIVDMAYTCAEEGADALSLVNTFNALAIDIENRRPVFNNVTAGLSGPAIKPIALRMVYEVAKAVDLPVVGIGGISNWKDAVEYIMAGATAVQVGTANFVDPLTMPKIIEGMQLYMKREGIQNLSEIRGIIGGNHG
ncbi:MAG: dihydroorotate dehydrogenase [Clostridiales bacterium]|nr:dihydroorotate dehydrogenase [Clostridiales bacterium]